MEIANLVTALNIFNLLDECQGLEENGLVITGIHCNFRESCAIVMLLLGHF